MSFLRFLMLLALVLWLGGIVFLLCSLILARLSQGRFKPWAARNLLVAAMLALTCIAQFYVFARMENLRRDMGVIDQVAPSYPRRIEFNDLHVWSTRLESGVLLLGLGVVFCVARRL